LTRKPVANFRLQRLAVFVFRFVFEKFDHAAMDLPHPGARRVGQADRGLKAAIIFNQVGVGVLGVTAGGVSKIERIEGCRRNAADARGEGVRDFEAAKERRLVRDDCVEMGGAFEH